MVAVIDIGSNSVRLMLWADGKSLYKRVNTTRLGAGIDGGFLQREAIGRTALAVKEYAEEGRALGAEVVAFATAAVRAAKNREEFLAAVEALCGIRVDVVSGEEEALLGISGALGVSGEVGSLDGGIVDIGGASTEICLREEGKIVCARSLEVGAVRLYDRCGDDRVLLEREIGRLLPPLGVRPKGRMYVLGGTGSVLACLLMESGYDAGRVQDFRMSYEAVCALTDKLFSLSHEERKALRGMDPRRADIIAGGALLLEKLMETLSLREIYASDRDNLEGYRALRGLQ